MCRGQAPTVVEGEWKARLNEGEAVMLVAEQCSCMMVVSAASAASTLPISFTLTALQTNVLH